MGLKYYWAYECLYNLQKYLGGDFGQTATIFLTLFGGLGVIGNILNLCILTRKELRSPLIVLIIFLSFYDLAVCAGYFLIGSWDWSNPEINSESSALDKLKEWTNTWRYFAYLIGMGYEGSGYMTALIAMERAILLWNPFSKSIISIKNSLIAGFVVLALIIVQTIVTSFTDVCSNRDLASTLSLLFTFIVPFIVSVGCNVVIIWKVMTHKPAGNRVGPKLSHRTTKLLVAIISINIFSLVVYVSSGFIIGDDPSQLNPGQRPVPDDGSGSSTTISVDMQPEMGNENGFQKFLRVAVPFINVFNCAINVLLYTLFNKAYFTLLKRMINFRKWFGEKRGGNREDLLFDK